MSLGLGARTLVLLAAGIVWIGASCGGLVVLSIYATSPGPVQSPPSDWPDNNAIQLSKGGPTLVLFAHPHCPCTRATLAELERIVASGLGALDPWIVFYKPAGADDGWIHTDLRTAAAAIPSVHLIEDVDGRLACLFHATTSGHAMLYDEHGKLVFQGGITSARGHEGDNDGRSAIQSYLQDKVSTGVHTPVFGCPIAQTPNQK
jgi:hypothetical protein